jgi:hypothetical protein
LGVLFQATGAGRLARTSQPCKAFPTAAGLLASEYVAERELPLILERHRRGEIDLIPLFLLPVPKITAGALLAIQGINQPTEPFAGMTDVEQSACLATLVDRLGDLLQIERV